MTEGNTHLNALPPVEGHTPSFSDRLAHQGIATDKLHHLSQMCGACGGIDLDDVHHHLGTGHLPQSLIQRTHLGTHK